MVSIFVSGLVVFNVFTTPQLTSSPANAARIYKSASRERVESVIEVRKEERIQEREELKEKIQTMQNERLRQRLLDMHNRFEALNDKWVAHWTNVLERLSLILDKVDSKASELESEGADISEVTSLSAAARKSILDAQTALDSLADKAYTFEVDDETTVGENVRETISAMKDDMTSTKELVFAAKEAVSNVFAALRSLNSNYINK